jgi:predicted HNH restriction endonuclease
MAEESASAVVTKRNANWTREELILALDLYLRFRESPPSKNSNEVAELSALLNTLGGETGGDETFRNANGVYMKMMNFRRFDPEYTTGGKVGLTRGNKNEEVVWDEFASDPAKLAETVAAIHAGSIAPETPYWVFVSLWVESCSTGDSRPRGARSTPDCATIIDSLC